MPAPLARFDNCTQCNKRVVGVLYSHSMTIGTSNKQHMQLRKNENEFFSPKSLNAVFTAGCNSGWEKAFPLLYSQPKKIKKLQEMNATE